MNKAQLIEAIERARVGRHVTNDQARAASVALDLEGDEAVLANRILAQGADPLSLMVLCSIEHPYIREAHSRGPGFLTGEQKDEWLYLASLSADESKPSTLRERVLHFVKALCAINSDGAFERNLRIVSMENKIKSLPFTVQTVANQSMRVYQSDLGFAAAYWSGEHCAAVENDELFMVGSDGEPFESLGIEVQKRLSPTFGLCFKPKQA